MKKTILLAFLAISALFFVACDKKQGAIDDLRNFSEVLKEESDEFSDKDWDAASEQYNEIVENLELYEYTDEELKEIGRLKAVCVKQMSKGAMNILEKNIHGIQKQLEGAFEEFSGGASSDDAADADEEE